MAHPREILLTLHANARKSFSQNFLTSPHWADLLTRRTVEVPYVEEYWEIGPGLGALTTQLLAKTSRPVKAFEIDRKLAEHLRQTQPRLEVIEGDFLDSDLSLVSPEKHSIVVMSNLPYHLSSPILFKLIDQKDRIRRLVLTFQKEFAERLIALPRTSDYGALSVIAQLHYKIESLGVLPPGAFYPVPAIASEALMLEPKAPPSIGTAHVTVVVKAAFKQRRKKLASNLKQLFPTAPIEAALERLGVSPMARPEELSKEQFVALTREIKPFICETICEK